MDDGGGEQRRDIGCPGQRLKGAPRPPGEEGETAAGGNGDGEIAPPFLVGNEQNREPQQEQGKAEKDVRDPAQKLRPGTMFFMVGFLFEYVEEQSGQGQLGRLVLGDEKVFGMFRQTGLPVLEIPDLVGRIFVGHLDLAFLQYPLTPLFTPIRPIGADQGADIVVFVPAGIGKILEHIIVGVRPFEGIEAFLALVIEPAVPVDAEGHLALDLFVPDVVGRRDGLGQKELGRGQEEQGEAETADEQRLDDQFERYAAGFHGVEFPGVIEDAESDDAGEENEDRPYLVDDEGDIKEKEFDRQHEGFSGPGKVVDLLEKIDQQIDGNEPDIDGEEIFNELTKKVVVQQFQGDMAPLWVMASRCAGTGSGAGSVGKKTRQRDTLSARMCPRCKVGNNQAVE